MVHWMPIDYEDDPPFEVSVDPRSVVQDPYGEGPNVLRAAAIRVLLSQDERMEEVRSRSRRWLSAASRWTAARGQRLAQRYSTDLATRFARKARPTSNVSRHGND